MSDRLKELPTDPSLGVEVVQRDPSPVSLKEADRLVLDKDKRELRAVLEDRFPRASRFVPDFVLDAVAPFLRLRSTLPSRQGRSSTLPQKGDMIRVTKSPPSNN